MFLIILKNVTQMEIFLFNKMLVNKNDAFFI